MISARRQVQPVEAGAAFLEELQVGQPFDDRAVEGPAGDPPQTNGVGLWTYRGPKGVGIEKCFHYLTPFIANPESWKKQQISKFNNDGTFFAGLAGIGLHDEKLLAAYKSLLRSRSPWTQFIDLVVKTA